MDKFLAKFNASSVGLVMTLTVDFIMIRSVIIKCDARRFQLFWTLTQLRTSLPTKQHVRHAA